MSRLVANLSNPVNKPLQFQSRYFLDKPRILDSSVQKGLVIVMAFFASYLNKIYRLNFMDDKTNNYIMQIVWNTVEYR